MVHTQLYREYPLGLKDLRWEFNVLFREELLILRDLTFKLLLAKSERARDLVPTALLIDFERFPWRSRG